MSDELPEVPEASDLTAGERLVWFGPPGPPGDRGLPGLDGVAGVAGATGAQGPQGDPGSDANLAIGATVHSNVVTGGILFVGPGGLLDDPRFVFNSVDGEIDLAMPMRFRLTAGSASFRIDLAYGGGTAGFFAAASGQASLGGLTSAGQFDYDNFSVYLGNNGTEAALFTDGTHHVKICDGTNNVSYTPAVSTDWGDTPPTDVWPALDYLAARPSSLSTGAAPGPVGPRGQDGNRWWSGQGPPVLAMGVVNDFYLDQRSGQVWQKQALDLMPPAWVRIAALLGPQGPAGTTGLPGTPGAPGLPGTQGSSGQAGAAGSNGMPLLGPRGQDGASWFSGAGVPAAALGRVQDYYLQTAADPGRVWQKQVSQFGAPPGWVKLFGLLGPAGSAGATGPPGPRGLLGPAGAAGPAGSAANDFGDGSDGAGSFTDGATHTLATTTGVDDTGIVLKQYTSLTITGASTIVTAANRAQVMVIKVTGNCTIGNGSGGALNMDLRGAAATPAQAISLARNLSNLWSEKVAQVFTVPLAGAAGGAGATTGATTVGGTGSAGSAGQTGGGGGGAGGAGGASNTGNGGNGAAGTCFCGGSGGGAGSFTGAAGVSGSDGASNGGQGGNSGTSNGANRASGAGAGNPVGTGNAGTGASVTAPTGGGGGTLILIVGGNLTIGAAGLISANGGAGGGATASTRAFGGGGAGGGSVIILYAGTLSSSGTIQASGGAAGSATTAGGAGGAGSVQGPTQISNP